MTVNISLRGPDQKAAPGAMPQPRRMVFQLVNTVIGETREPDLANRPQAIGGQTPEEMHMLVDLLGNEKPIYFDTKTLFLRYSYSITGSCLGPTQDNQTIICFGLTRMKYKIHS